MKKDGLKSDKFKKARGGPSRLLELACTACGSQVCRYQKDGPGSLKRLYLDRMIDATQSLSEKELVCPSCKKLLGVSMIYKKEQRLAYRLIPGTVSKQTP